MSCLRLLAEPSDDCTGFRCAHEFGFEGPEMNLTR